MPDLPPPASQPRCPCCGQPPPPPPVPHTESPDGQHEYDHRGVPLPPRTPVGGIITPQ